MEPTKGPRPNPTRNAPNAPTSGNPPIPTPRIDAICFGQFDQQRWDRLLAWTGTTPERLVHVLILTGLDILSDSQDRLWALKLDANRARNLARMREAGSDASK